MNSGPLSQRISSGARPRRSTIRSSTLTVSSAPILRAAGVASASRVCSSVTVRIFIGRPSAVRSTTKSIAHTSFGQAAARWPGIRGPAAAAAASRAAAAPRRATAAAPACGYRPSPRGAGSRGCAGSRNADDAGRAAAAAPATAPLPAPAAAGSAARSDAGSSAGTPCRSETPKRSRRCTTALRRRSGLRSFPEPPPAACRYRAPAHPRSASTARSPSPAPSTAPRPPAASP